MRPPHFKRLLGLGILLGLLFFQADLAEAGRGWAGGDSRLWSVQKTCVNGGLIMGIHSEATNPDWDPSMFGSSTTTVTPYLIKKSPADAVAESLRVIFPDGSEINETRQLVTDLFEVPRYHGSIGAVQTFEILKETTPLQSAATSDTLEDYYGYVTDGKLYFHRDLNVGDLIYYSIRVIDTVQDCRIEDRSSEGATTISLPNPALGIIPNERLVYTVEQAADSGTLKVGSVTKIEGQTFTADDLTSQSLVFSGMGGMQTAKISAQATYRVSVNFDGTQLNGRSGEPSISGTGKEVAFTSEATNIEELTDTNHASDVFKRISTGIVPISAVYNWTTREYDMGNDRSSAADLSPNGLFTAFASEASNLVGTTNCPLNQNIFVVRATSDMSQMSCATSDGWTGDSNKTGASKPSLPDFEDGFADQSAVVYETNLPVPNPLVTFDSNNQLDIVGTHTTPVIFSYFIQLQGMPPFQIVSSVTGNSGSSNPQISADGNHVTFKSGASNLVGNDTNGETDIFVRNGIFMRRMTLNSAGEEANSLSILPAISRFGEHVSFASAASNLASDTDSFLFQVYVRDRNIDGDTNYDDTNDSCTVLVSKSSSGAVGNDNSTSSSISADGRLIAFVSRSDNLVEGDTPISEGGYVDIFVHDRDADGDGSFYSPSTADDRCTPGSYRTVRVSVNSYGVAGNGNSSGAPDISANGEFVAFSSKATNLVPNDTNGVSDIFVHYLGFTADLRFSEPSSPMFKSYLPFIRR